MCARTDASWMTPVAGVAPGEPLAAVVPGLRIAQLVMEMTRMTAKRSDFTGDILEGRLQTANCKLQTPNYKLQSAFEVCRFLKFEV